MRYRQTTFNMNDIYTEKQRPRKLMKVKETCKLSDYVQVNKKYWQSLLHHIDTLDNSSLKESQKLAEALPEKLYHKVCATLNLPIINVDSKDGETIALKLPRHRVKEPQLSHRKCLYIDKELESDTDVEYSPSDEDDKPNIHQELLSKPEREQITWATHYLQPEKEDEKSLVKKADDLTDRIANEFCEYMKQLGGDQQSQLFTPKAIKELFQIEFDTHAARSLRVVPKELPSVEDKVAFTTQNLEKSRSATIEREISKDIKAEQRANILTAFGQSLPMRYQYHAPRNHTKKLWRSARHVPRDLVTLKTVWEGITNLRSVKEYCRWMIEHPEHRRPPYLSSLGLFDPAVLNARLTFEAALTPAVASKHDNSAPIELIHRKLSELVDSN